MSDPSEGAERREELLNRIQETDDRHDAAQQEADAKGERINSNDTHQLRLAIEELRSAAADTRRANAEMRQEFFEFLQDLRKAVRGS
jgi:hypothetical protein